MEYPSVARWYHISHLWAVLREGLNESLQSDAREASSAAGMEAAHTGIRTLILSLPLGSTLREGDLRGDLPRLPLGDTIACTPAFCQLTLSPSPLRALGSQDSCSPFLISTP